MSFALVVAGSLLVAPGSWARVVINEILYHPSNDAVLAGEDAERLEFIELVNTGPGVADLSGASFASGLTFTFPAGTHLEPGAYLVVAQDPAFLALRGPPIPAGVAVFRWTAGVLSNGGERLRLVDAAGNLLDEVTFDDAGLWPRDADGRGASLELTNPAYDNDFPLAWRASGANNGTPGARNGAFTEAPIILSETPERGSIVAELPQVAITFASAVSAVAPGDLVVDGSPAAAVDCPTCIDGVGAGPWIFTGFAEPRSNPSQVTLAPGAIRDQLDHAFTGDAWLYPLSVPRVVINEVHYNPASATDAEEFIELLNADVVAVDLSGWRLLEFASPGCLFGPGTVLQPGEFLVCARNPGVLAAQTGHVTPFSWGDGDSLSNGGEPIVLLDANGTVVDRIEYDDAAPWPAGPAGPDGNGPSMELVNPGLDNAEGRAWRASLVANGTPGAENSVYEGAPAVASELPRRGSIVVDLEEVVVTFSEPVIGVAPDALTLGPVGEAGVPATAVRGEGAGPYVFAVDAPAAGVVEVVLAGDDITSAAGTPFAGDQWLYFAGLPAIVINEIHYHPRAATPAAEAALQFIELYNAGPDPVDLTGFALTEGVDFIFPPGTHLDAGGYLVLAHSAATLRAAVAIPDGVPVLEWTAGNLANSGERIELSDPYGHVIDTVSYEDGGEWTDEPDGRGPSLELINPLLPNDGGGAWQGSVAANGTPGAQNSRFVAAPPPLIFGARHDPPLPRANQPVTITARVIDDGPAPPTVTLYYREDRNPPIPYASVAMFDDGQHGDGAAGDGRYGATLPGLADQAQLDFYVEATDGERRAVAPALHDTPDQYGNPSQTYLCKFTNEVLPADGQPTYHLIVTLHNKQRQEALTGIARKQSFDATFIDGAGNVWYNVTQRYRGQSSLSQFPSSYRIDFPRSRKLRTSLGFSVKTLQLHGIRPVSQYLFYDVMSRVGLPTPRAGWAHLRYPGINYDTCCNGMNGYYGLHLVTERPDNEFLDSQGGDVQPLRPTSSEGNLYRGRNDATLRWEGANPATYFVNANGQNGYEKYNNEAENYWGDVIGLCDALSNTPDEHFAEHVRAHVDEDAWANYFAVNTLMGNREGGIYRDTGDDYFIYFPPPDDPLNPPHPDYTTPQLPNDRAVSRSIIVPWDGDSVLLGANETIWRQQVPAIARFLRHNAFAPIYVKAMEDIAADQFAPALMNEIIDSMPERAFGQAGGNDQNPVTREQFKRWIANRLAYVHGETRDALTLEGGPRFEYAGAAPAFRLQGQLQQAGTHNVTVNGQPATFSVFAGTWSYDLPVAAGVNPARIEAWDREGRVKQRIDATVFYNPPGSDELHLEMRAPVRMLNDKTLTVDVAISDPIGRIHYQAWNELGTLSVVRLPDRTPVAITNTVFDPHQAVQNGTIRFMNGWGSASFTLNQGAAFAPGDIEVSVEWQGLRVVRRVTVIANPAFRDMQGSLVGDALVWGPDEVIRVTGGVTVPAGSTLTIHPGTLIQVNTTGGLANGTLFTVNGNVQAVGTADRPIFFFSERGPAAMTLTQQGSASNANAWRGFQLRGAGSSTFRHVILTGAGNGPVVSHPRPPIVAMYDTHSFLSDRSVYADNNGMAFSGLGTGRYTVRKTLVSRVGIGAEFLTSGHTLRITDSWFTRAGHAPEANNLDGDLLHIDGAASNQLIRSCVIQDSGDDGVDHTNSRFRLEHSIIWGIRDKAISMTGGHADLHNVLMFRSAIGLRGFGSTSYTTIATPNPITSPDVVRTSIIWPASINTCGGNGVQYTDVGNPAHLGCGPGNFSANPQYVDTVRHDYNPAPGSPALTAGPDGGRIGWLGFPFGAVCAADADCDDGNACTTDTCQGKLCKFTAIVGCTPCDLDADCDDGNACTTDTCQPNGACGHAAAPEGTACSDGLACTGPDTCAAGTCGGPVNCPGGAGCGAAGECLPPPQRCADDAACDDGRFCNGVETCDVGTGDCRPGAPPSCDDGVACTTDTCDDALNGCRNEPVHVRCDDGDVCTDDLCDPAAGCRYVANTAACDDGDPCTTADTCSAGACVGGPPPSCDDGVTCTADRCVPGQGCMHDDQCGAGEICAIANDACEPAPTVVGFRNGVADYNGTTDTYVHAGQPDDSFGQSEVLIVDGDQPPEEARQILIRFDDLFGWNPGQIPPNAHILSATLTLWVTEPSDDGASLHRVFRTWEDDATWSSLGAGIALDGVAADDTAEVGARANGVGVPVEVTVTGSLVSWLAGAENLGWVIVAEAGGSDAWEFASSEAAAVDQRPVLTVVFRACERGFVGDGIQCADEDECAAAVPPCDRNATCTNVPGSFTCACNDDFFGDGFTCDDVDECLDDPCDPNALCVNLPGEFFCECAPGFTGDGFTCGECPGGADNPCSGQGACVGPAEAPACECVPDLAGPACEVCVPGHGGYPNCWACPGCDDGNPCTTDDCDEAGACIHINNANPCDDGDACTTEDRCGGGACRGEPIVCDDGNACTRNYCEGGECFTENTNDACDDGNACTDGDTCTDGACVGSRVDCEDGNVCTDAVCDPTIGCIQTRLPDCCVVDATCDDDEGCVANFCQPVVCAPCVNDTDCGAGANRCVRYPSGTYCEVACDGQGAPCPDGTTCRLLDGNWMCRANGGDCDCEPQAFQGCHRGNVVWFDGCSQPGEVVEACGARGCLDDACCEPGTHREGNECVADPIVIEPDAGVPEPDAGGDPRADMGVEPDAELPDAELPDAELPDAELPDAAPEPDAAPTLDGGREDMASPGEEDVGAQADTGDEDQGRRPDRGLTDASPTGDAAGDAGPRTDLGQADGSLSGGGGAGGCECNSRPGSAPSPLLLLLGCLALARRRLQRRR